MINDFGMKDCKPDSVPGSKLCKPDDKFISPDDTDIESIFSVSIQTLLKPYFGLPEQDLIS